ncbi:hypothetical protein [Ruegeria sp. Ofav3-42]|uniref:hypothetical protein n=1 Tax=Ruegeria sp. Ofav3-42 TaxID=2917759 RepID=UPI001EF436ED|nr:hypothetical protein [Ruegeria sp. Ofav3-42]MCG7519742.1 hypothetical protein [Ruegeria sp. Ofav3-42]
MEKRDAGDWESAVRAWAKTHKLRLKVQWYSELQTAMADLDSYRFTPAPQDRWLRVKEWMERHNVSAVPNLPRPPEPPNVRY